MAVSVVTTGVPDGDTASPIWTPAPDRVADAAITRGRHHARRPMVPRDKAQLCRARDALGHGARSGGCRGGHRDR